MKRVTFLFAILLVCASSVIAQNVQTSASSPDSLYLIPYPQQIKVLKTDFRPDANTVIRVCAADQADYFAGEQLHEEFSRLYAMNLEMKKTKDGVKNSIVLTRPGISKQADLRLRNAGLELPADFNPEGYVLLADEQGVIISANSAAGLYYGVQTLRQLTYPAETGCTIRGVNITGLACYALSLAAG